MRWHIPEPSVYAAPLRFWVPSVWVARRLAGHQVLPPLKGGLKNA